MNQSRQTRSFTYDFLQRLTSATNAESGTVNYTSYDGNGNLLSKTDANNVQVTATYDELNRVKTKTYVTAAPVTTTAQVSYTYDDSGVPYSIGRLTKVANGNTWQILGYDPLGRPTSNSQTINALPYTFPTYVYNRADNLTSITYPSGRAINTSYDQADRINGVSGVLNSVTTNYAPSVSYASHGGISVLALRNSQMTEQWCYNNRLQPTGIRLGSAANGANVCSNSGSDLLNLAYTYSTTNNNGNLLSQTIARGVKAGPRIIPAMTQSTGSLPPQKRAAGARHTAMTTSATGRC